MENKYYEWVRKLFKKKKYIYWIQEFHGSYFMNEIQNDPNYTNTEIISASVSIGHGSYGNDKPMVYIVVFRRLI